MANSEHGPHPSDKEIARAAQIIRAAATREGFLPPALFQVIAGIKVASIVELVPLRESEKGIEVLLFKREDDPVEAWQDKYHNPGANILLADIDPDDISSEHGYERVLDRLVSRELGGTQIDTPVSVGPLLHRVARGPESSMIFRANIIGEPKAGELFYADKLPENLISTNKRIIQKAVTHYQRYLR